MKALDRLERDYMIRLISLHREAMQTTAQAREEWEVLNDELNDKLDRDGIFDIVERSRIKDANLGLKSAMSKYTFWASECMRFAASIQAERDIRELLNAK